MNRGFSTIRPPRGRGLTLIELVISMGIMTLLIAGLTSAVVIASHALPDRDAAPGATVEMTHQADRLIDELSTAIWITRHTATSITFSVPDRDGDGNAEQIDYDWSGSKGDPLLRTYNGGTPVEVDGNVRDFALAYDLKTTTEEYPGVPVESSEQLWDMNTSTQSLKELKVTTTNWIGQYFQPSLLADATGWSVTRVFVEAAKSGSADGKTLIQLQTPDVDLLPSGTVLDEQTMDETSLPGGVAWQEIAFENANNLAPGTGVCLVVAYGSGSDESCKVRYNDKSGIDSFWTFNGGGSWAYSIDNELRYYAYGTWTQPGTPQTATRSYVTGVRATVLSGGVRGQSVRAASRTLNDPELLSGMWETDFEDVPTLDHNGDGVADWSVHDGSDFKDGSLAAGVWIADTTLDTGPASDFDTLTTVELRCRSIKAGVAAVFTINADRTGTTVAPLAAYVQLLADNTQQLVLTHPGKTGGIYPLYNLGGLTNAFVDLRLLIDPALDTINIQVNGVDRGTYSYNSKAIATEQKIATIYASSKDKAEFDRVSIRVSE